MRAFPGPKTDTFHLDGLDLRIRRVSDDRYVQLHRRSIAIADDGYFLMRLLMPAHRDGDGLDFPRAYFILNHIYGRSGRLYDDWKGSFAFPFSLDVIKGDSSFPYLLNVHNHRSMLEFSIRKVVADRTQADGVIRPPDEREFSRTEINYFIAFFYGYLEGRLQMALKFAARRRPFVHKVQSNLILYGCRNNQFFEEEYDSPEEFEAAYLDHMAPPSRG